MADIQKLPNVGDIVPNPIAGGYFEKGQMGWIFKGWQYAEKGDPGLDAQVFSGTQDPPPASLIPPNKNGAVYFCETPPNNYYVAVYDDKGNGTWQLEASLQGKGADVKYPDSLTVGLDSNNKPELTASSKGSQLYEAPLDLSGILPDTIKLSVSGQTFNIDYLSMVPIVDFPKGSTKISLVLNNINNIKEKPSYNAIKLPVGLGDAILPSMDILTGQNDAGNIQFTGVKNLQIQEDTFSFECDPTTTDISPDTLQQLFYFAPKEIGAFVNATTYSWTKYLQSLAPLNESAIFLQGKYVQVDDTAMTFKLKVQFLPSFIPSSIIVSQHLLSGITIDGKAITPLDLSGSLNIIDIDRIYQIGSSGWLNQHIVTFQCTTQEAYNQFKKWFNANIENGLYWNGQGTYESYFGITDPAPPTKPASISGGSTPPPK